MDGHQAVLFCFFIAILMINAQVSSVAKGMLQVIVTYPKNVHSERDLSECPEYTACNVLFRRFWLPPLVERHCRCKRPLECSSKWEQRDNHTMDLDNRAQIKFCEDLRDLSKCEENTTAIAIEQDKLQHTTQKPVKQRNSKQKISDSRTATAFCHCSDPHFWEPAPQQGEFLCTRLQKCKAQELCGYIRTDLHSTNYICSCPEGHQCVSRNKTTTDQQLLFYSGPVYSAYCLRPK